MKAENTARTCAFLPQEIEPQRQWLLLRNDCGGAVYAYACEVGLSRSMVNFIDPMGMIHELLFFDQADPEYQFEAIRALADFMKGYLDLQEETLVGADKYYHCKASCEAKRRGHGGEDVSAAVGELVEIYDEYAPWKRPSSLNQTIDCDQDRAANERGREGDESLSCEEICKSLLP